MHRAAVRGGRATSLPKLVPAWRGNVLQTRCPSHASLPEGDASAPRNPPVDPHRLSSRRFTAFAQREQRACFLLPTLALTPPNLLPITESGTTLAFQRQALDLVAAAAVGGAMGKFDGTAKSAADRTQLLYTHLTSTLLLRRLGLIHIEWHRCAGLI